MERTRSVANHDAPVPQRLPERVITMRMTVLVAKTALVLVISGIAVQSARADEELEEGTCTGTTTGNVYLMYPPATHCCPFLECEEDDDENALFMVGVQYYIDPECQRTFLHHEEHYDCCEP